MGSEDVFHKRKPNAATDHKRAKPTRKSGARYLIVCEGSKTEPNYFQEICDDLRIPFSLVQIAKNIGSSPDKVVKHAETLYDKEKLTGDPFDEVYCVFDRDTHSTFDAAVKTTKNSRKSLNAITSTPCFEFWLLLHFGYTAKAFQPIGKKSAADQVISALKTKPAFSKYAKAERGIYGRLKAQIPNAQTHAKRLREDNKHSGSSNPATNVDELVNALLLLAKPNVG